MKKLSLLLVFTILFTSIKVKADEGMWLPIFLDRLNYTDMQKMGLNMTPEELYSINKGSLKDAICGLASEPSPRGFFCTGEIVSDQGLMFTNHHCGYDIIQKHSSVEHDYLADGFWAMSKEEELPNEGLTASILYRMADVTEDILSQLSDTLSESARTAEIRKIRSKLEKESSEDGKYNVVIKSFFEGNEYYMFVYQTYKDVRLVGAPPSSIGKFGGDTDNWMWPRHTGDFSIFRVYTAPDGSPAEYSEENVPMTPKHYLPISMDPVQENEFSMTWGFPGGTERYLTSSGVDFKVKEFYPPIVEVFGKKLEVWKEHMNQDQEVRIKYASNYAGIANAWKLFIGQDKAIADLNLIENKKNDEDSFMAWVNEDKARTEKYGETLEIINKSNQENPGAYSTLIYASIAGLGGSELVGYAREFGTLKNFMEKKKEEKDKKKKAKKEEQIKETIASLKEGAPAHFKNYDLATDEDVFAALTELYMTNLSTDMHPEYLTKLVKKFKGDYKAVAKYVYDNSNFSTLAKVDAFLDDPSLKAIEKDPAVIIANEFLGPLMQAQQNMSQGGDELDIANRLYIEGIREWQPEKKFYPDANSTLRFSYGKVMDYYPADAIHYDFVTHLSGVMEKEDPENDEFIVSEKLKELYANKDYGQYGDNGKMITCFLTSNDITGGNSGSPVLNGNGELTGLAFDGNWEAMSSDIAFAPKLQRTIVVDIHYVLLIIDKFAGATNLIDELTLVKSTPVIETQEVIEVDTEVVQ
eukprot:Anaeramoba_flamelloidesa328151_91.p1 GENE.a328151_91~~a328151_91.p1  ORF type:complete len:753 (-),score=91.06 a328151_91:26-2284(-)